MRAFRAFVRERLLEIVLLYLALQLMVSGVSAWLPRAWLVALGVVILVGVVAWLRIVEGRRAKRAPYLGQATAFTIPRSAVIFTVGLRPYERSICPLVLRYIPVKIVGLLATPEVMGDNYKAYRKALEDQGITVELANLNGEDFVNIVETTDALISRIFDNYNLAPADVVLDITGGPSLVSVGTFFAAEKREVDCQVILAQYENNTPIPETARPVLVVSHHHIGH